MTPNNDDTKRGFTPERRRQILDAIQRGEQIAPAAHQNAPQQGGARTFTITAPDGRKFKVTGDNPEGAVNALQTYLGNAAQPAPAWQSAPLVGDGSIPNWQSAPLVDNTSDWEKARPQLQGRQADPSTIAPAPSAAIADELWQQGPAAVRYLNPQPSASASLSAAFRDAIKPRDAGALHSGFAGALQGATFNFGDEAMARVLSLHPQIDYDEALPFIRKDMERAQEQHPTANLAGTVAGAVAMPGKTAANFINKGMGTGARMVRGALAGGMSGAVAGAGNGETADQRVVGALGGAAEGAAGGWAITGLGQGFNRVLGVFQKRPDAAELMPSVAGLRDAADDLYRKVQASTATVPESSIRGLAARTAAKLRTDGFDRQLHPRVAAVLDRLQGETGPKSLAELEILRRVAGHAASSLQPDERRLAMQVIDQIDDTVEGMGGDAQSLVAARAAWAKMRRMGRIEEAIEKAALQDDFAAGLRNQFKVLIRNPKTMRGFSETEAAAIRAVATGTPAVKALRALGAAFSPKSLSGWGATGAAVYGGAGMASAAIPIVGAGAKKIADMLTQRMAEGVRQTVGQSDSRRAIVEALLRRPNVLARAATVPGLMGSYLGLNR